MSCTVLGRYWGDFQALEFLACFGIPALYISNCASIDEILNHY